MKASNLHVRLTLIEPQLGTRSARINLLRDYIISKGPNAKTREEEIADRGETEYEDDLTSVFERDSEGNPYIYDYQIKGFFKESMGALKKAASAGFDGGAACNKIRAHKKEVDLLVFPTPRRIPFNMHGLKVDTLSRPLRANTPQGERVAITNSEMVPDGSTLEFDVRVLKPDMADALIECLDYGKYHGLGQWRNARYGAFTYELFDDDGKLIQTNKED